MPRTIFVTGTDTGIGKTYASCALVLALRKEGLKVGVMKPVASGCVMTAEGLRSEDALQLIAASGSTAVYADINPVALEAAIAPHLAAAAAGLKIDTSLLDAAHDRLAADCDILVVEGAGGWAVPYDAECSQAHWVSAREWPVLLVVGLRLGCLNHASLSAESIARRTSLIGWIGNRLPPEQAEWQDNVSTLTQRIPAPLLACLPPDENGPASTALFDRKLLLSALDIDA